MNDVRIFFIDGTDSYFDKEVSNFVGLCVWLKNNNDTPFEVKIEDGPNYILYKHAIKYVISY